MNNVWLETIFFLNLIWIIVMTRGGKIGLISRAFPFYPHFFTRQTKIFGLHPLICPSLSAPFFAGTNFKIFFLQFLGFIGAVHVDLPHPHFSTRRTKVLNSHPKLCLPRPTRFFELFYGVDLPVCYGWFESWLKNKFGIWRKMTSFESRLCLIWIIDTLMQIIGRVDSNHDWTQKLEINYVSAIQIMYLLYSIMTQIIHANCDFIIVIQVTLSSNSNHMIGS